MFSYYGSKSKVIDYYPAPLKGKIIEPFAGSARYSLKYFDREVTISDKYKVIYDIWVWLQAASEKDVLSLPFIPAGGRINRAELDTDAQYELLRFMYQQGTPGGNKTYEWGCRRFLQNRRDIADNLFKIRHWKILNEDFTNLPNEEATWFIDPPYFQGGNRYKHSNKNLDYEKLSAYSKERDGQVIVCENSNASWMEFDPLCDLVGIRKKSTECMWTNIVPETRLVQYDLFGNIHKMK